MCLQLEPFKNTNKNAALLRMPKECPQCRMALEDVSALMMGPQWECKSCGGKWMSNLSKIIGSEA